MATQTLEETTTTPEVESQVGSSSSERQTRERKKVERFSLPTPIPNKSVSIEKGRGTPLREIPNVAFQLSKRKADDNLILLHTILYGKKAKAQMIKKNIGQFSGFVWSQKEEEEEKQRGRVKEKLDKCIKEKRRSSCQSA
ncbi:DEK domain-containing chromatin-associated protein 2-like [Raphanus sativus]|uniref:DEK domain-containing chromatin-associated protein 2-like n=1 Tax=Raphanus sativus TaxID=3726 RepID=A0A9W3BUR6_RAPSA|nr:DEK domain-containing chromatin-associated protein 2-like [Raphanus sativus]